MYIARDKTLLFVTAEAAGDIVFVEDALKPGKATPAKRAEFDDWDRITPEASDG